jgi:hypothetical protein
MCIVLNDLIGRVGERSSTHAHRLLLLLGLGLRVGLALSLTRRVRHIASVSVLVCFWLFRAAVHVWVCHLCGLCLLRVARR